MLKCILKIMNILKLTQKNKSLSSNILILSTRTIQFQYNTLNLQTNISHLNSTNLLNLISKRKRIGLNFATKTIEKSDMNPKPVAIIRTILHITNFKMILIK